MAVTITIGGQNLAGQVIEEAKRQLGSLQEPVRGLTGQIKSLAGEFTSLRGAITALGIGFVARDIIRTALNIDSLQSAFKAITGSSADAAQEIAFVRTEAKRLGVDLISSAEAYKSFAASAKGTAIEGEKTREIFSAVAEASAVLGLSAEATRGALNALTQMISKGTVQAEELRGQLSERIPGAFNLAAKAMGITTVELNKMLEQGQVLSADLLPRLARALREQFSGGLVDAINSPRAALGRFMNAMTEAKAAIAAGGFMKALADEAQRLAQFLGEPQTQESLKILGQIAGKTVTLAITLTAGATRFLDFLASKGAGAIQFFQGAEKIELGERSRFLAPRLGEIKARREREREKFRALSPVAEEFVREVRPVPAGVPLASQDEKAREERERGLSRAAALRRQLLELQGRTIEALQAEQTEQLKGAKLDEERAAINALFEEKIRAERRKTTDELAKAASELAKVEQEAQSKTLEAGIKAFNDEQERRERLYERELEFEGRLGELREVKLEQIEDIRKAFEAGAISELEGMEKVLDLKVQIADINKILNKDLVVDQQQTVIKTVDIWADATGAIANGFMRALDGVRSFGDLLLSFFRDLTRSITRIFIEGLAQKIVLAVKGIFTKVSGGGSLLGTILETIFGKGAPAAAGSAPTAAVSTGGSLLSRLGGALGRLGAGGIIGGGIAGAIGGSPLGGILGGGIGGLLGFAGGTALGSFLGLDAISILGLTAGLGPIGLAVGAVGGGLLGGLFGGKKKGKDPVRAAIKQFVVSELRPALAELEALGFGRGIFEDIRGTAGFKVFGFSQGIPQDILATMKKGAEALKNIIAGALQAGFRASTEAGGFRIFLRDVRRGLAEYVQQGLIEGILEGKALTGLFAPTVEVITRAISEATLFSKTKGRRGMPFEPEAVAAAAIAELQAAQPLLDSLFKTFGSIFGAFKSIGKGFGGLGGELVLPAGLAFSPAAIIPSAQAGGLVTHAGLINVHAGERITSGAKVINAPITVNANITGPMDADGLGRGLALALERQMRRVKV